MNWILLLIAIAVENINIILCTHDKLAIHNNSFYNIKHNNYIKFYYLTIYLTIKLLANEFSAIG